MRIQSTTVALLPCTAYVSGELTEKIDQLCAALAFKVHRGARVLLKPNLLTGRSPGHLACTHPAFVAAVAGWFVDHGARVAIGDSPAFGTTQGVLRATGIREALAGLPVDCVNFERSVAVRLAGGVTAKIARAALDCDILVNLPRLKAHSQLYVTLGVKNYFGTVVGLQKPLWHLRYGDRAEQFASHLVDLLQVLPDGMTLLDGIIAMHGTGPISGQPYPLGLAAGAVNPVALDTGILQISGLDPLRSPVWQECARRRLTGTDPDTLDYPLSGPVEFSCRNFIVPPILKPVSFNPLRMLFSTCRRFAARFKESP